jgi:phosphoribosylpyrophosphate synthetase
MLSVAGADHIITMDLHASQIQVPNSHIQGEHYLKRLLNTDPDPGL